MVVKTVVHFEIPANDVERQKQFYSECFGWKFQQAKIPGMEYWMISTGPRNSSVGGGMYKKMAPNEMPRNYVNVGDIDSAIQTFRNAGGSEIMGKQEVPGMGWTFIGSDPEGNAVGIWQSVAKRPAARKSKKSGSKKAKRR